MSSTTETEQPVNAANITEVDVFAFVSAKNEIVKAALADPKVYAIVPRVAVYGEYINIRAYLNPNYDSVIGSGRTTEEAIACFRDVLNQKRKDAAEKLRSDAAAKIAEAELIEAGGTK